MDAVLHLMRNLARRHGVVVWFVFVCGTLLALLPPPSTAAATPPAHHTAGHAMDHSSHHETAPHANHHGSGGCCVTGKLCPGNCIVPLAVAHDLTLGNIADEAPLVHLSAATLSRPPQPPRRPPKA